jgi:hypothetical protein
VFQDVEVSNEAVISFDHTPMTIKINGGLMNRCLKGRFMKLIGVWSKSAKKIIKQVWCEKRLHGDQLHVVQGSLEGCKSKLIKVG